MSARAVIVFLSVWLLLSSPAMATRLDDFNTVYRISIDPVHPSGGKTTITCNRPSCQFTVDLMGQAPLDAVAVQGPGGLSLYFRQAGFMLPVDAGGGMSLLIPASAFAARKTMKIRVTLQAPSIPGMPYPISPLGLSAKNPQPSPRSSQSIRLDAEIRQVRP